MLDPGNRCQCTTKASACSVTFFVTAGTIRHYGIDLQMLLDKAQYSMIKFFVLDVSSCRGGSCVDRSNSGYRFAQSFFV